MHPARLLGAVQRAVLDRAGVEPGAVGQVIGGTVTQIGEQAYNVARTAWLAEVLPEQVPATTVDAQCGSSQQTLTLAAGLVGAGLTDIALACGVESMTRIPIGANYAQELGLGRPVPRVPKPVIAAVNGLAIGGACAARAVRPVDRGRAREVRPGWPAGRDRVHLGT